MYACATSVSPQTGILDVGAYEGSFSRGARQIFKEAHILMIDALAEKGPVLADVCREVGNADHLIAMLGDRQMEAASFYVVNTKLRPDLVKTGSSKFKENANFPIESGHFRNVPSVRSLPTAIGLFSYLSSMFKARNSMCCGAWDRDLSQVEVILMEMSLVDYNEGAPLIDGAPSELAEWTSCYTTSSRNTGTSDVYFRLTGCSCDPLPTFVRNHRSGIE